MTCLLAWGRGKLSLTRDPPIANRPPFLPVPEAYQKTIATLFHADFYKISRLINNIKHVLKSDCVLITRITKRHVQSPDAPVPPSSKHVVSAVHPSVNELQWLDGQFWGLCSGMTVTHFPLYVNIMVHKFSLCFSIIPHSFLYESVSQWNTFITWWRRSTEPSENKCLAWSTEASLSTYCPDIVRGD